MPEDLGRDGFHTTFVCRVAIVARERPRLVLLVRKDCSIGIAVSPFTTMSIDGDQSECSMSLLKCWGGEGFI